LTTLIGYARVSTRHQSVNRQEVDLLSAGIRRDDLYVDHGVSGTHASRPQFDRALEALEKGDTLVITTHNPGFDCFARINQIWGRADSPVAES